MQDREKLIELVHNARMNALWHNAQKPSEYITDMLISDGVTVRERGRWVDAYGIRKSKCTSCGVAFGRVMDADCYYCPNCGADMRGEEDA